MAFLVSLFPAPPPRKPACGLSPAVSDPQLMPKGGPGHLADACIAVAVAHTSGPRMELCAALAGGDRVDLPHPFRGP